MAEENLDMFNSMTRNSIKYILITAEGCLEALLLSHSEMQQKLYFVA